ncbi:hypothetical protein VTK26DRAFT_8511 [Humicola hyalothermophila]
MPIGPGPGLEKEMGVELGEEGGQAVGREDRSNPTMSIPPEPPAKEVPKVPAPPAPVVSTSGPSPGRPPSKPLPPIPMSMSSNGPSTPQPTRSPPRRAQAPLAMNPPTRPGTAASQPTQRATPLRFPGSTKRLSWSSIVWKRPVKYGRGNHGPIELVPQPSDDPDDPLNWPVWRKEVHYGSLLLMVAMTGVMKTIYVTVNAPVAEAYGVSYTAVAALTGVPLIISAFTGLICLVASRSCGNRPLYLISLLLVFIGAVWNTNVERSYAQCMAARIFQGLGWGAFDTLTLGSIQDTYFEHERGLRIAILTILVATTTWGPPLLGGVVSQRQPGVGLQFSILGAFFAVAVPAVTLGVPETAFNRASASVQTPATAPSLFQASYPIRPRPRFSLETIRGYIGKLKPYAYNGNRDVDTLLQCPRAFVTPTIALITLAAFLPHASLWGLAASLSLMLGPSAPSSTGVVFAAPWLLSTAATAVFAITFLRHPRFFTKTAHLIMLGAGSALTFTALLALGLHLHRTMAPLVPIDPLSQQQPPEPAPFLGPRDDVSLATAPAPAPGPITAPLLVTVTVSVLLALLAAAAALLTAPTQALISASTAFTASNFAVATRATADMSGAAACWRSLGAGIFAVAVPAALTADRSVWDGLKAACIGVAVAQVVVGPLVGAVWWFVGEGRVKRGDGKVLGLVGKGIIGVDGDLEGLQRTGSFFDLD